MSGNKYARFGQRFGARLSLSTALSFNAALSLAAVTSMVALPACSGGSGGSKHAKVKAGDMPTEGNWTGVYYSPSFGYLHLTAEAGSASGKWRTASGDKWGEMHGKLVGNRMRFEWVEPTIGMVGPTADSHGKGYFVYSVPPGENVDHELHGEWGMDTDEAGHNWDAVKQRLMKPDPDSVMPGETQNVHSNGGWDESKSAPSGSSSSADSEEESEDW